MPNIIDIIRPTTIDHKTLTNMCNAWEVLFGDRPVLYIRGMFEFDDEWVDCALDEWTEVEEFEFTGKHIKFKITHKGTTKRVFGSGEIKFTMKK